jgi:hypothetical protein
LAGADFYPLALKVLQDLDSAVESTRQLRDKLRGTVRIACTPLYASSLLPSLLSATPCRTSRRSRCSRIASRSFARQITR